MTTFDTIAIILLSISAVYSVFRGMIKEIFSLASYVAGYAMAVKFQDLGGEYMGRFLTNETAARVLGFILIFLAVSVMVNLIGFGVRKLIRTATTLSLLDRIMGGAIGVAKGAFFIIIFLVPLELFPDAYRSVTKDSIIAPPLEQVSTAMRNGLGSPKKLMKKMPGISIEKIKKKLDQLDNIKIIQEKLGEAQNTVAPKTAGKPQDEYTEKDVKQLQKILESMSGDDTPPKK